MQDPDPAIKELTFGSYLYCMATTLLVFLKAVGDLVAYSVISLVIVIEQHALDKYVVHEMTRLCSIFIMAKSGNK